MRKTIRTLLTMCVLAAAPLAAAPAPAALDGDWQVSLDIPEWQLYDVRTRLRFDGEADGRFAATTRPGAVREVYGVWRALLARLLSPDLRAGAWLHLVDGRLHADGAIEATVASGFAPRLAMRCPPVRPLDCTLLRRDAPFGRLRATPLVDQRPAAVDYAGLSEAIAAALHAHHYAPDRLASADWQRPLAALQRAVAHAHDDLDVMAAWQRWSRAFPDSHLALLRTRAGGAEAPAADADTVVQLRWEGRAAVLRIEHFRLPPDAVAARLRGVFAEIDANAAAALIVDLRGNTGGNLGAMLVAGHLLDQPAPAGHFVTRRWWNRHTALPTPDVARRELPPIAALDVQALRDALREGPGAHATVQPRQPAYRGPVYLLVDRRSASAAEPLVHLLQQAGRATVVGERSAGAMLSSETVAVAPGWTLRVPVADYYGPDGVRLEGRGVVPDVRIDPDRALQKALALAPR